MTRTNTHEAWMQQALAEAQRALPQDVPVGALVITAAGKIIGAGCNRREAWHDPTAHAEMIALKQAGETLGDWRLSGCTLYVTLEPCPMCASALLQARIATIVFGADDPVQGALGSLLNLVPLYPGAATVIGGVLEQPCQTLLQDFFKAQRR